MVKRKIQMRVCKRKTKLKALIALHGAADIGKSETLVNLSKMIIDESLDYYERKKTVRSRDRQVVARLGSRFVGICTAGDTLDEVVVSAAWFDAYGDIVAAAGGDKAAALMSTAANGRKVWECFMLGVDPTAKDDDFRITSFRMENGKPVFEFSHTTDGNGESFVPRIRTLGKAKLTDAWQEVPEQGDATFRFFTVEVELP